MTHRRTTPLLEHLRRSTLVPDGVGLTDGQLLTSFLEHQDAAAFAALVRRHGPMVWGVCRRVLDNCHDAEDAFQATFVVLVRKAASIVPREKVANWLYGVACMTARRARAATARRRVRERQVTDMPEPEAVRQDPTWELQSLLDQELSRLPDRYRNVIVLCDLEGKTRKQTAQQIGCPEGTVAGHLARARTMLAKRLAQRGVMLSSAALAALHAQQAALACVPPLVMVSMIKTVTLIATGQGAATGLISAQIAALTEGVLKDMFVIKLKTMMAMFLVLGLATLGSAMMAWGKGDETRKAHGTAVAPVRLPEKVTATLKTAEADKEPSREAAAGEGGDDRIQPGDRLQIQVLDTPPEQPIKGVFRVESGGTVALGPNYGRVQLKGQTLAEAEGTLRNHLAKILKSFAISVTRYDPSPDPKVEDLERRLQQLEVEVRTLRATVEQLRRQQGK